MAGLGIKKMITMDEKKLRETITLSVKVDQSYIGSS